MVDYVSSPESSAYDRALELAQEISANAPLALRAAKQAISRVPDVGLESGKPIHAVMHAMALMVCRSRL